MSRVLISLFALGACASLHAQDTAPAAADGPKFARNQAAVRGMLVKETAPEVYAAMTSQMTATVTDLIPGDPAGSAPAYAQTVGPGMAASLQQVHIYMQTLRRFPEDKAVRISFQDPATLKDGPSSALASALLMESLFAGLDLNPDIAVTGSVTADGKVRPVGAIADKLRAASKDGAKLVIMPAGNTAALTDLVLSDGPELLLSMDIHGVPDVASAISLSRLKPDAALARATENFGRIRTAVGGKKNAVQLLAGSKGQELLATVLKDAPTHLGARILQAASSGKGQVTLSAAGSLGALKEIAADFIEPLTAADQRTRMRYWWWREGYKLELADELRSRVGGGLVADQLGERIFELTRIRKILDKRTVKLADFLQDFGNTLRAYGNLPQNAAKQREDHLNRINTAWGRLREETQRLDSDRNFQDDLMKE